MLAINFKLINVDGSIPNEEVFYVFRGLIDDMAKLLPVRRYCVFSENNRKDDFLLQLSFTYSYTGNGNEVRAESYDGALTFFGNELCSFNLPDLGNYDLAEAFVQTISDSIAYSIMVYSMHSNLLTLDLIDTDMFPLIGRDSFSETKKEASCIRFVIGDYKTVFYNVSSAKTLNMLVEHFNKLNRTLINKDMPAFYIDETGINFVDYDTEFNHLNVFNKSMVAVEHNYKLTVNTVPGIDNVITTEYIFGLNNSTSMVGGPKYDKILSLQNNFESTVKHTAWYISVYKSLMDVLTHEHSVRNDGIPKDVRKLIVDELDFEFTKRLAENRSKG